MTTVKDNPRAKARAFFEAYLLKRRKAALAKIKKGDKLRFKEDPTSLFRAIRHARDSYLECVVLKPGKWDFTVGRIVTLNPCGMCPPKGKVEPNWYEIYQCTSRGKWARRLRTRNREKAWKTYAKLCGTARKSESSTTITQMYYGEALVAE